jgi:anti-anti-sigma factor
MQDHKKCRKTRIGLITFLAPEFPLAEIHVGAFREEIEGCLADREFKIVLDLRQVPYADSAGLEALIDVQESLRKKGGTLKIANPNPICKDALIATRLMEQLEVFSDMEVAGRSFL